MFLKKISFYFAIVMLSLCAFFMTRCQEEAVLNADELVREIKSAATYLENVLSGVDLDVAKAGESVKALENSLTNLHVAVKESQEAGKAISSDDQGLISNAVGAAEEALSKMSGIEGLEEVSENVDSVKNAAVALTSAVSSAGKKSW